MFRASALIALLAVGESSRVEKHNQQFGATCEDLQASFGTRLARVRESVDTADLENLSRGSRAMLTMRMYGIGRTLRRARDCDWVQNTDAEGSENVQQAQALVNTLLGSNPCAEAARAEMTIAADATEEERARAMQNAMEILTSDHCVATPEFNGEASETVSDAQIDEAEASCGDGIEDMMADHQGSSFAETNEKAAIERFIRFLVVVAIFLFLVVLCTMVVVWIGLFIIEYFALLLGMIGVRMAYVAWERLIMPPALLACGYDLFYRILNPEIHALPHHW